jgi:hypothetical protein
MSKKKKKHDKQLLTFTKVWVSRLLWFGCGWVSLSYLLAFLGKEQIAETLSERVVVVIVATILGYMLKAFFETFPEEHNKLKREGLARDLESSEGEEL